MPLLTFNDLHRMMAAHSREFSLIHASFEEQAEAVRVQQEQNTPHPVLTRLQRGLQVQQHVSRVWCELAEQHFAVTSIVQRAGLGDARIDFDPGPQQRIVDYQQRLFHTRLEAVQAIRDAVTVAPAKPEKEHLTALLNPTDGQQLDFAAQRGFPSPMLDLWQYCKGEMLGFHADNLRENGLPDSGMFWTANTLREVRSYLEDCEDVAMCASSLTMANTSANAYLLSGPDLRGSAGHANNLVALLAKLPPKLS